MLRKLPVTLLLFLLAATVSVAAEIKVARFNCYLLFDSFTQFSDYPFHHPKAGELSGMPAYFDYWPNDV